MGRAEIHTLRRFVVVEDDQEGRESLKAHLNTDGDAVIAQGEDLICVGKDQIKPLAVFLLSEIGETSEAVSLLNEIGETPADVEGDPFPWERTDPDGDNILVEEWESDGVVAIGVSAGVGYTQNVVTLNPRRAESLGLRLIAWARDRS